MVDLSQMPVRRQILALGGSGLAGLVLVAGLTLWGEARRADGRPYAR